MTSGCHTQVVSEISLTLRKKQVNPRSVLVCGKERGCSNPLLNTQRDALWLLAGSLLQFQLRMGSNFSTFIRVQLYCCYCELLEECCRCCGCCGNEEKWRSEVVRCHVISPVTLACHFLHFPHNFHEFKENVVSGWFVTWGLSDELWKLLLRTCRRWL